MKRQRKPASMEGQQICSICQKPYAGFGNNAYPFPSRCCDSCNAEVVIPARLQAIAAIYGAAKEDPQ